jgi:YHS domain-containing protein
MLLRAVVLIVIVLTALSAIRRLLRMLQGPRQDGVGPTAGGDLVQDPVCRMYVPKQTALSAGNQFFCSEECRSKYLSGPRDLHPPRG